MVHRRLGGGRRAARAAVVVAAIALLVAGCSSGGSSSKAKEYPTASDRPVGKAWAAKACPIVVSAREGAKKALLLPPSTRVATAADRRALQRRVSTQLSKAAARYRAADHALADLGTPRVSDGSGLTSALRAALVDGANRYSSAATAVRRVREPDREAFEAALGTALTPVREGTPRLDAAVDALRAHRTLSQQLIATKSCKEL